MRNQTGRYSGYIRPFSYVADIVILGTLGFLYFNFPSHEIQFYLLLSAAWLAAAVNLGFYEVYRYTKLISILNCAAKQFMLFAAGAAVLVYLFYGDTNLKTVPYYVCSVAVTIQTLKIFIYYFLKKYRLVYGGNFKKVIMIGNSGKIEPLQDFFSENLDYGYQVIRVFSLQNNAKQTLKDARSFILENNIDELYCAMSDLNQDQIVELVNFSNTNLRTIKFIPDENQIVSGNYVLHYYGYIRLLALRSIHIDEKLNKIIKRFFDIIFSVVVIVSILSWLTPILAFLIKNESKGPVFFTQMRNGLNNKLFKCYKFRSMELNPEADSNQISKNDARVTKIGNFLRRRSIDELPQFYNVLLGDMSVVGPRPHMVSVSKQYAAQVNNFMIRHLIKPGITGLAQIKGFRGEVESDTDIINRVKYDIFYLENWSLLLDFEIILRTIFNIIKGDKKAY